MLAQAFNMEFNCLADQLSYFLQRGRGYSQPGKIGDVGAPTCRRFFVNSEIFHFEPACYKILFNVPGGMSTDGWPAAVTVPGLTGWILPVAAFRPGQSPSGLFQPFDDISDFHRSPCSRRPRRPRLGKRAKPARANCLFGQPTRTASAGQVRTSFGFAQDRLCALQGQFNSAASFRSSACTEFSLASSARRTVT